MSWHGLKTVCGGVTLSPQALVVSGVRISDLAGNQQAKRWDGLIDTGADRTAVPLAACHDLKLSPRDWRAVRGFDPESQPREFPLYYVGVAAKGVGRLKLLAYGVEKSYVLLGRDFISGITLLFDGAHSRWQMGRPGFMDRLALSVMVLR